MFVNAIEEVSRYVSPLHIIYKKRKQDPVITRAHTIFFINEKGVAITCRHVAEVIEDLTQNMPAKLVKHKVMKAPFFYTGKFRYIHHPDYDLSIMIAEDLTTPPKHGYARFMKDSSSLKPGRSLCLMGYPMADFTNYWYNDKSGELEWTNTGRIQVSEFPVEGMLTRLTGDNNTIDSIEMSGNSLRGHSGSPVFNRDGLICGMTRGKAIFRDGRFITTKNSFYGDSEPSSGIGNQTQFSYAVHVDIIKNFLKKNGIKYYEG